MAEKRQAARSLLEPDDLDGLDVRQLDCVLHFKGSWPDRRQRRVNRALDRNLGGGENMSEGRRTNKQNEKNVNAFHCNQFDARILGSGFSVGLGFLKSTRTNLTLQESMNPSTKIPISWH